VRNKAPLALIELLIMLLVFAIGSAWCMQAFSSAKHQALYSNKQDLAVLQAQNAVELLKHYDGNFLSAAKHMGGSADDFSWHINYDSNWNITASKDIYRLQAEKQKSDSPIYGKAIISVYDCNETLLCSLPAAWQEVDTP